MLLYKAFLPAKYVRIYTGVGKTRYTSRWKSQKQSDLDYRCDWDEFIGPDNHQSIDKLLLPTDQIGEYS